MPVGCSVLVVQPASAHGKAAEAAERAEPDWNRKPAPPAAAVVTFAVVSACRGC